MAVDDGERTEDEASSASDDDDDGEEPQEIPQQLPRPNAVYNLAALHEKLEEIGWPDGIDWMQTLLVQYDPPGEIDVNDDLAREMAFYTQALEGTREAYNKLQEMGVPFLRPEDYYAEMVKTDTHMLKVKDKLLTQQKQFEEVEERRKSREAKRFSKEVQAEKLKERAQEKKQNIDTVKKWRKMRQKRGYSEGGDDFPVDLEEKPSSFQKRKLNGASRDRPGGKFVDRPRSGIKRADFGERPMGKSDFGATFKKNSSVAPWDRSGSKGSHGKSRKGRKDGPGKNRQSKNERYGHGGKKSFKKQNTAESSAGGGGHKGRFQDKGRQKRR